MKLMESGDGSGYYLFMCPGCNEYHKVGPSWKFNDNLDNPTFQPSILVRSGCKWPNHNQKHDTCWCTHNAEKIARGEEPSKYKCYLCHSYITDGKIMFLNDCTHSLAGQTVDLPEIKEHGKTT